MHTILGIDPGLLHTGWGLIGTEGSRLRYIASGSIHPPAKAPLGERLKHLHDQLTLVVEAHRPMSAALEETFVSHNGQSTLKLGQARGAILLTLARHNLEVHEYAARLVKKSLTGTGRADKDQMTMMVNQLLPGSAPKSADEADALAIAICHSSHAAMKMLVG